MKNSKSVFILRCLIILLLSLLAAVAGGVSTYFLAPRLYASNATIRIHMPGEGCWTWRTERRKESTDVPVKAVKSVVPEVLVSIWEQATPSSIPAPLKISRTMDSALVAASLGQTPRLVPRLRRRERGLPPEVPNRIEPVVYTGEAKKTELSHMDKQPVIDTNKDEAVEILSAARRHVFSRGFASLTLESLSSELGIRKKVIYERFRGKQLLVESVISTKFSEMETDLAALRAEGGAFAEWSEATFDVLQRHVGEYEVPYVYDIAANGAVFIWVRGMRVKLLEKHFGWLFEHGHREEAILSDISGELFSRVYMSLIDGIVVGSLEKKKNVSISELHRKIIDVLWKGTLVR